MSKDIDESYRNITFQLYHIAGGLSTLSVEIGLNSLKKPNRHTLRQPNSVLRKIRLIKTLVFFLSIAIPLSSVHHPSKPLSCPQSRLFKMPALVPFKSTIDALPRQQIITLTDTVAHL